MGCLSHYGIRSVHKNIGVFYKLRDKERSKESAYVLAAFRFLARPFVSFISLYRTSLMCNYLQI